MVLSNNWQHIVGKTVDKVVETEKELLIQFTDGSTFVVSICVHLYFGGEHRASHLELKESL